MGLLRPDGRSVYNDEMIALNPFGFISDIKLNESSLSVLIINLIIFIPMYFLQTKTNIFKTFIKKLLSFEVFGFLIEFLQFLLNVGVFDLSDIFLYNIGFFVGYLISQPLLILLKTNKNNQGLKGDL
jgi:glycopeptide antibiotics resistance protein